MLIIISKLIELIHRCTILLAYRYIYVVDSGNDRIVRWTTNYAAGGTCIVGCSGSGSGANQLNSPRDIKFDSDGNLYVSDQGNNRIQKFSIQYPGNCTPSIHSCSKMSRYIYYLLF